MRPRRGWKRLLDHAFNTHERYVGGVRLVVWAADACGRSWWWAINTGMARRGAKSMRSAMLAAERHVHGLLTTELRRLAKDLEVEP